MDIKSYDEITDFKNLFTGRIPVPILQHTDGCVVVHQRFSEIASNGYGFYTSKRFEGVASGATTDIYFENPAGSGRNVYLVIIDVTSTESAYLDFYHDNTISTAGTALTTHNLNFTSTNTPVLTLEYDGSYTLGGLVHQMLIPSGRGVKAVGGATELGEAVIIPPDHNFVLRITNSSTSSADTNFRMIWWEEEV